MKIITAILVASISLLAGCNTNQQVLDTNGETQLQKRSYQTRIFDTNDKKKVMRAVISTLQDLGFVIEKSNYDLGSISGAKYDQLPTKITVTVREKGKDRTVVRANAQYHLSPIEDPKQYQNFFSSLEKSLFLTAHAGE